MAATSKEQQKTCPICEKQIPDNASECDNCGGISAFSAVTTISHIVGVIVFGLFTVGAFLPTEDESI